MSANPHANTRINISVKESNGSSQMFNMKKSSGFKKMMKRYAMIKNLDLRQIAFRFDGTRLKPYGTPNDVKMEEGDQIDAVVNQSGVQINEFR